MAGSMSILVVRLIWTRCQCLGWSGENNRQRRRNGRSAARTQDREEGGPMLPDEMKCRRDLAPRRTRGTMVPARRPVPVPEAGRRCSCGSSPQASTARTSCSARVSIPRRPGASIFRVRGCGRGRGLGPKTTAAGAGPRGDRVVALTDGGGYAEFVAVNAHTACRSPRVSTRSMPPVCPRRNFTVWSNVFSGSRRAEGQANFLVQGGAGGYRFDRRPASAPPSASRVYANRRGRGGLRLRQATRRQGGRSTIAPRTTWRS